MQQFPGSVRLHLTLARSLEASHRYYGLRRALRAALNSVPGDLDLLRHRARVEDTFGAGAPAAYRALAEGMTASPGSKDFEAVLEQGFNVSLRQNDIEQARWFAARATGGQALSDLLPAQVDSETAGVACQGACGPWRSSPTRICKAVPSCSSRNSAARSSLRTQGSAPARPSTRIWLGDSAGTSKPSATSSPCGPGKRHEVSITLSVKDRRSLRKTRRVLGLLGWRLKGGRQGYSLQPVESESGAERQEIASALEIDELAIQEALAGNQDYVLRMKQETAPSCFGRGRLALGTVPG